MKVLETLKKARREFIARKLYNFSHDTKYVVEGIVKNKPQMLFVLSGYKPYLWDDIFSRIKKAQTEQMEVCIASSGKYCSELSELCKRNDWVYVSTKLNNICVATNIVMRLFSKADYIFKLDEDIYVSENYFSAMIDAYTKIETTEDKYKIGYVCPVLPLGFYGMHDFLIRKNCLSEYEERFGKHYVGGTEMNPAFRSKKGIDEFIWEKIANFDQCAAEYNQEPFSYELCATRSGIAAILFRREFWNRMGFLRRTRGAGLGDVGDEGLITSFCALNFRACFCVKNIFVGHFAFGGAEPGVLKLKEKNPQIFNKQ